MSYTDDLTKRLNELEEEAAYLRGQYMILVDFLLANFADPINHRGEAHGESAAQVAIRLLGELRGRRQQIPGILERTAAELERRRQRIEVLTTELVETNQEIDNLRRRT